jgi:two-component system chemotaxis sensor kinase CheA
MFDDAVFLQELMVTFRQDAEERVRLLSRAVVDLEVAEAANAHGPIEILFRETHSLKGAAGAVEHTQMESICQAVESVLAGLKREDLAVTPLVVDVLSESVDCLDGFLRGEADADDRAAASIQKLTMLANAIARKVATRGETTAAAVQSASRVPAATSPSNGNGKSNGNGQSSNGNGRSNGGGLLVDIDETEELIGQRPPQEFEGPERRTGGRRATDIPAGDETEQRAARAVDVASSSTDTVRVSTDKLESLMLQAEEFISLKLSVRQRASALRSLSNRLEEWKREWYQARIGADPEKMVEFIEWNSTFMEGLVAEIRVASKQAEEERRSIGAMVDELVDDMKRVLMLPVAALISRFPKMVRDLARLGEKQVELSMTGAEIEIDKRIIENLKDPLVHLLRNSVDHGIESPEIREGLGKPARGQIKIAVSRLENNRIEICVADDGQGIDVNRLREVAVREGLRTQANVDALDDLAALRLIFASGLSTTSSVSTVSGRGLGMAIVEEKVETLGGFVTIESRRGKGTAFRIVVPATLATARGVLAQVSDWPFVIPVANVDRVVRVHKGDIHMVENRETILLEGRTVPLVHLSEVMDLASKPQCSGIDYLQAVVAGSGDERVAFAVDRVLDEQEVLVKSLGPQLARVPNIAGGTILGSGKVVPIINVSDLLVSAARTTPGNRTLAAASIEERKSVLVVEDSITSRMLLKNVLEAAGYNVKPTVDGLDALNALRDEDFDLVICDIDMPRMDGLELTASIRRDPRHSRLPVILVTALESEENKAKGIDAGANAYLVKNSFSKTRLLETARSLL